MRTIHKYRPNVLNKEIIHIRGLIELLSVAEQKDNIAIYALVDTENKKITNVDIAIVPTGENANSVIGWKFLGTVNLFNGEFIFHVYYKYLDMKKE